MNIFSVSFSWKTVITRAFFTLLFLFILTVGVFAAPNGVGSLYEKWLQEIFVSLPEGDGLSQTALENPTVQRAHTLVDENGAEVAQGAVSAKGEKVLLVGTDFASEDTMKVYGEDAAIQITADSGNPELSLGDSSGSHGSIYLDSETGELRVWTGTKEDGALNGQNGIEISGSGDDATINFPEKLQEKGVNVVTAFECGEDEGVLAGFDEDGNPLCSSDTTKTSWVSVPTAGKYVCSVECGGGEVEFDVQCKSGDNFTIDEEDQVCLDLGLEKPLETRECNMHACKEVVNGGWSSWEVGNCNRDTGYREETRTCSNPSPFAGGANCSEVEGGNDTQNGESCVCHFDTDTDILGVNCIF